MLGRPPRRRDRQQDVGRETGHRQQDERGHEVVVDPPPAKPQEEPDGDRQREMEEVEDGRDRGQDVRAAGRVERVLEDLGRQVAQEERPLEGQDVGDVDGQADVVGVAAHQLVGEEQADERDPVAQEQPTAAEQHGGQTEGHEEHVGGDRHAADEHQRRQDHDVGADRPEQDPVVAPAEAGRLGLLRQLDGHEPGLSNDARQVSASS